ncbi:MAG TPA: hypothetical protein VK029_04145 [Pseudogracilibacillus sp.]|nr:hypothetical protein [Pseudogracilibacillus sp.]
MLDTFIVRGVLLPSLLVLFQKNELLRLVFTRKKKRE